MQKDETGGRRTGLVLCLLEQTDLAFGHTKGPSNGLYYVRKNICEDGEAYSKKLTALESTSLTLPLLQPATEYPFQGQRHDTFE